jgi:hypothetical protein
MFVNVFDSVLKGAKSSSCAQSAGVLVVAATASSAL